MSVDGQQPGDSLLRPARKAPADGRSRLVEMGLLAGLVLLAIILRAERLMTVPAFTDESIEVLLALEMLSTGRINPVGTTPYLGGLHTWLLMALFSLPGAGAEAPRLLSLGAGILTVLLTYAVGRELAGRWGGLLAGGLLAANLAHVGINSRIAWSNCLTPLFTTAGLLLLVWALRRDRPWLLVPAAVSLALAQQTHPSVVVLVPGLVAGVLLSGTGRRWLRTRWPWLALIAAAIAYGNVIWVNTITGGRSLTSAQGQEYAFHPATTLAEFRTQLSDLLVQLARNFGSSFEAAPGAPLYPITITMAGVIVLTVIGITVAARRGAWLLPAMLLSGIVLMAYFGGEYQPMPHSSSRYLGPLWPALFVLTGLGAVALGQRLRAQGRRLRGQREDGRWPRLAAPVLVGLLALVMIAESALTTWRYLDWYAEQPWLGSTNQFALDITEEVATRYPDRVTYLDQTLHEDKNTDAGTMHRSLAMLLRSRGQVYASLGRNERQTAQLVWEKLGQRPGLTVMRRDRVRQLEEQGARLTPVGSLTRVVDPADGAYRLYEMEFAAAAGR